MLNSTEYDVALSFSTPDTSIAEQLYALLQERGIHTYYYIHQPGETLGADLKKALRSIYGAVPQVVIIHSRHYETPYTAVELAAALTGAAEETGIFPLLIDTHPLPRSLQGRTYWTIDQGMELLVALIAKQLTQILNRTTKTIQSLIQHFEVEYQLYRNQLEKTTSLAVKASTYVLPRDVEHAEKVAHSFTALLETLPSRGNALRQFLSEHGSWLHSVQVNELVKTTIRLEDIAVKSLDYQVQKLGREERLAYLPFETVLEMRKGTASVLMNYNQGFTESLFKYDALFGSIKDELNRECNGYKTRLKRISEV